MKIILLIIIFLYSCLFSSDKQLVEDKFRTYSDIKNPTYFNHFQYNISSRGDIVLSSDKKSFYINDIFGIYKLKQIDVNSSKLVAKSNQVDDYIYALTAWDEYLLARQRDGVVSLLLSSNSKIKTIKSTKISTKSISKAIVKDKLTAFIIDEDGTVFEINKALTVLNRYQLKDLEEENSICYDKSKNIIYFATKSKQIKALSLTTNRILFTSKSLLLKTDEYAKIYHLRLDKTKTKLIGAFDDKLAIFDIKSKKVNYFGENFARINALEISANFKYIISTGLSGGLKIWDYKTQELKKELHVESFGIKQSLNSSIDGVKFLDDDRFLYASNLEDVQQAKVSTNKKIRDYSSKKRGHWLKKLSQNKLVIISPSGSIYNYDLKKKMFIDVDKVPLKSIKRVESNGENRLLFSEEDGKFILLDIHTKGWKDYSKSLREHYTAQFALHPTEDKFARLSSNGTMQIFDMKSAEETLRIKNDLFDSSETFAFLNENIMIHSSLHSAFTKEGDYATLENSKPYLQFININKKKIYHKKEHSDVVNSFELSKDKKHMITASADKTLKLWQIDLKNIQNSTVLDTIYGDDIEVYTVRFNEKENQIVSFGESGSFIIRDIDLKKGKFGTKPQIVKGQLSSKGTQKRREWEEVSGFGNNNITYGDGIFYDNDTKIIVSDSFGNIDFYDIKNEKILYRIIIFGQRDWLKLYADGRYESSKNGYKYLHNKTFDIDITDEIVLKDVVAKKNDDKDLTIESPNNNATTFDKYFNMTIVVSLIILVMYLLGWLIGFMNKAIRK